MSKGVLANDELSGVGAVQAVHTVGPGHTHLLDEREGVIERWIGTPKIERKVCTQRHRLALSQTAFLLGGLYFEEYETSFPLCHKLHGLMFVLEHVHFPDVYFTG